MSSASFALEGFAQAEITKLRTALTRLEEPNYVALLESIAEAVASSLRSGNKIMFCGNGGSAADSQHLAAELVGRQNYNRAPAAGLALTVDTSALTAIGNDYGFENVFSRQVEALGNRGDVLFGISTSGCSPNVVNALKVARTAGIHTIAFTGDNPNEMIGADLVLAVPAPGTAQIQELHLTCGHIVLALVEQMLFPRP
jgi:D-sedoheptulose 7-phosphate isomerase